MPLFRLTRENIFPSPDLAEEDGLLAIGGDLSKDRLLLAYSMGIFPWYSESYPILWWSPDPRLVLLPEELKVSRSLRQVLRSGKFRITFDTAFRDVIGNCAVIERKGERGTWITPEMERAYVRLHDAGFAHSAESWRNGELVGGLYGVALGGAFFGESMFSRTSNASKAAFVTLVEVLRTRGYRLIDCQVTTGHLLSFGAREMPRREFIKLLETVVKVPNKPGSWTEYSGG